jgi:hypothetical protein
MKLPPLTNALPSILPALGGELLSPSLPNSVCERKKTSLSGWLPLPPPHHLSPGGSFLLTARLQSTLRLLKFITQTPSSL